MTSRPATPAMIDYHEKDTLIQALKKAGGNQTEAGRILGVSRITVWKRMKKYGISP
jgi:transcriptional regulator of acetoin/glycerol metabolism